MYKHKLSPMLEGENVRVHKDFPIPTDCVKQARYNNKWFTNKNKWYVVEIAIMSDENISSKQFVKLSKYKDMKIAITRIWHLSTSSMDRKDI